MSGGRRMERCPRCGAQVEAPYQGPCPGCNYSLRLGDSTALAPPLTRGVMMRDLVIFELKLLLDGLGDVALSQLAVVALLFDMIRGGPDMGKYFYKVLRLGERWDLWLNLYGAAKDAEVTGDGLFGASRAGADSLVGKLEEMVRERQLPGKKSGGRTAGKGRTGDDER